MTYPEDVDRFLAHVSGTLTQQFAGTFGSGTIAHYVNDSHVALHRTAWADRQFPELAQRFAADRLTALTHVTGAVRKAVPEVLFVCIHNAGRSQMGAALMAHYAVGRVNVRSAGSPPDSAVSRSAAAVLAEVGVPLAGAHPKPLTDAILHAADVVVIAGGGEACPRVSGPVYVIWDLPHPPSSDLDAVRALRDDIDTRVRALLTDLTLNR